MIIALTQHKSSKESQRWKHEKELTVVGIIKKTSSHRSMSISFPDQRETKLCMLHKIFHNPLHPLHSELPNLFYPRRVTRGSLNTNSLSLSPMTFNTSQYFRCFIPATTKLRNDLPSMTAEAAGLKKFKLRSNAFLLGVDGL